MAWDGTHIRSTTKSRAAFSSSASTVTTPPTGDARLKKCSSNGSARTRRIRGRLVAPALVAAAGDEALDHALVVLRIIAERRRDVLVFVERTGFRVSSEQAQRVEDVVRAAFKPVAVG